MWLGVRQASLYYYFASKEGALELVCVKGGEGFVDAAKAIFAGGPGKPSERLQKLINAHLSPLLDRGDFVKVFLNERQHLPGRRAGAVSASCRAAIEQLFEDVIKEGVRAGRGFRSDLDTRLATLAVLGMANAVAGLVSARRRCRSRGIRLRNKRPPGARRCPEGGPAAAGGAAAGVDY